MVHPVTLLKGESIEITYQATLTSAVVANQYVISDANLQWSSSPESMFIFIHCNYLILMFHLDARNRSTPASASVLIAPPTISLFINSTSLAETPYNNVTVGEVVSLNVNVLLPQGITNTSTLRVAVQNSGTLGTNTCLQKLVLWLT